MFWLSHADTGGLHSSVTDADRHFNRTLIRQWFYSLPARQRSCLSGRILPLCMTSVFHKASCRRWIYCLSHYPACRTKMAEKVQSKLPNTNMLAWQLRLLTIAMYITCEWDIVLVGSWIRLAMTIMRCTFTGEGVRFLLDGDFQNLACSCRFIQSYQPQQNICPNRMCNVIYS